MSVSPTISLAPPPGPGLNYVQLLEEAIGLTQELSGDIWTDYNEHDPGVTIVEQLCYAITELAYRAGYPVADLLVGAEGGAVDLRGQSLYPVRAIMPNAPVTPDDFRRRIIDLIPDVRNVWLIPLSPSVTQGINGLYELVVYAPGVDPCACDGRRPEEIREAVLRVFCRYRALCEDVETLRILEPVKVTVSAVVTLDGCRDSAAIMGAILFAVGLLFAPEPRRKSLGELIEAGATPAEIFDGPLLRNGFIEDDQLSARAAAISVADVLRAMAGIDGVVAISDLTVFVGPERTPYVFGTSIPVPIWAVLSLTNGDGEDNPIHLFRSGVQCHPDPARVKRELAKSWAAQRRTYSLAEAYPRYFPVPQGQWPDPSVYYSIQNQFPNVYGISEFGLPSDASPMRRGQARQLKGYLLAFEQLLADYFSQLAEIRNLYSARTAEGPTYFCQSLDKSVPLVAPLLRPDYLPGLDRLVASQDPASDRRDRFLSYLLALYAQELSSPPSASCDCQQSNGKVGLPLIEAKRELLHRLVPATRDRGRGFDYRALSSRFNRAGMEIKTCIELGLVSATEGTEEEFSLISMVENSAEASFGRLLGEDVTSLIDRTFIPVDPSLVPPAEVNEPSPLSSHAVETTLLQTLQSMDNFRLGVLPRDRQVSLTCKAPDASRYWHLGTFASLEDCFAELGRIIRAAARVLAMSRRLYMVDHILLRHAREAQAQAQIEMPDQGDNPMSWGSFDYSFSATAVLSASILGDGIHRGIRDEIMAVVRRNTPALVVVECCFLTHRQMRRFQELRWSWLASLRRNEPEERAVACARLQYFLMCHGHGGESWEDAPP